MPTTKKTPAAKKAAAKKTPARKRALGTPAAAGPVTLAEARALAGVEPAETPRAAVRRAAPVRRAALAAPAEKARTPEDVAIKRQELEQARREEEHRRIKDYAAVMKVMKRRGVKDLPEEPAVAAKPARRRAPGAPRAGTGATGPLQVLAEGDSWFDYPVPFFGGGIIPRLEDRLGVPILNLAKAGDEVRYMLGVKERKLAAEQLRKGCPAGGQWDVLLFSGGGNDIVGDPMALWVRDYQPGATPASLIHTARFQTALDMVQAGYEDLIALRDALSPQTHLVFHTYDYAIPDGRGICFIGPWLKPAFDMRGFPLLSPGTDVAKLMLTAFAKMLAGLAAKHQDVSVINGQGTLDPVKGSWHNELHPSKQGFKTFADLFHQHLKSLFPTRVLA